MSGFAASCMSTLYLRTKRRMISVVMLPASALATSPAKTVIACFGKRYCGSTAVRSDTMGNPSEKLGNYNVGCMESGGKDASLSAVKFCLFDSGGGCIGTVALD